MVTYQERDGVDLSLRGGGVAPSKSATGSEA